MDDYDDDFVDYDDQYEPDDPDADFDYEHFINEEFDRSPISTTLPPVFRMVTYFLLVVFLFWCFVGWLA